MIVLHKLYTYLYQTFTSSLMNCTNLEKPRWCYDIIYCMRNDYFPEIRCNTSPRPIGLSPEFLSNGTERCARNAAKGDDRFSAFHNFLITSVLCKLVVLSRNWVDVNSLFQPSAWSFDCGFSNTLRIDWRKFYWMYFFWFFK